MDETLESNYPMDKQHTNYANPISTSRKETIENKSLVDTQQLNYVQPISISNNDIEANFTEENPDSKSTPNWDRISELYPKEVESNDDFAIAIRLQYYLLTVNKDQNDHLIEPIINLMDSKVNKFDYDSIYFGANKESLEYTIEYEKLESSNDLLSYYNVPFHLTAVAVFVFVFQIAVLVTVIATSYQSGVYVKARSAELVLARVFIAYYLSLQLTDSMSTSLLNSFHEIVEGIDCYESEWVRIMACLFLFPPIVLVNIMYVLFVRLPFQGEKTLSFLMVGETVLQLVMCVATAIITKQQDSILDSVFNFVGLLLILDLDELVVKTTSFTVKVANFKTGMERDTAQVKFIASICFCVGLVVYLLE